MMMQTISNSDASQVPVNEKELLAIQETNRGSGAMPRTTSPGREHNIEGILERYNFAYILSHVKHIVHLHAGMTNPAALDMELEDMAQEISIRFWQKLREGGEGAIQRPEAYIARMIRNRCIDMARRLTRTNASLPLALPEHDEIAEENSMACLSDGMADPAQVCEYKERKADWSARVAAAIATLPARQKMAMLCLLLEQVDDLSQFLQALAPHGLSTQAHWPENKADARLLKASLHAARQTLARRLNVDLSLYKQTARRLAMGNMAAC